MTYADLDAHVTHVGSALRSVSVTSADAVGVYSANCPEWMIAMKSVDRCGAKCVPLYDTFGPDAVKFIIQHSGIKVIFVATDKLKDLVQVLPTVKDQLTQVVVWSSKAGAPLDEQALEDASNEGVPVTAWDKFEKFGKSAPADATPGSLDSLCTIMYTSGTTGEPKGVEITNRAVLTTVGALIGLVRHFKISINEQDVFLSYLPLAHVFGRVAEEAFVALGGSIGYWQGDPKKLMDDVGALKPTIFAGVPRIFDRVYSGVTNKVSHSGWIARHLFGGAYFLKDLLVRHLGVSHVPVLDQVVFKKVKDRLGGRVKIVISGGAPLASHVERFLKVTMCCPVSQGYGLTETCGASFVSNPAVPEEFETVGVPVAGLQLRLEAVKEMGYDPLAQPPRGEVCLRGPPLFAAYHKKEELTKESLDADGWYHTGDVGELNALGALRIIDRKKNFFKLAHGEYVAAEKLENVYKQVGLVDQIWVYGDSAKSQLVAVVVPDEGTLTDYAKHEGLPTDLEELCKEKKASQHVQQQLEKTGRAEGLKGFEIVKAVLLCPEAFSVENDLMTPSFKLKRPQLKKRFSKDIDELYASLE